MDPLPGLRRTLLFFAQEYMPPKIRALKALLRGAGFRERHGKGSHTVWEHADLPNEMLTISGADGNDAKRYQESDVRVILAHLREALKDRHE